MRQAAQVCHLGLKRIVVITAINKDNAEDMTGWGYDRSSPGSFA